MSKAVRLYEQGGPEVLKYDDITIPTPSAGEAQIRHAAIGLNYIDVYHRSGLYPLPQFPAVIGMEGAGTVEAVGEGVVDFAVGDRIAYAAPPPPGAYAELRNMPAQHLVKLPQDISFEQGAAMMLQGMTVEYLILRTYHALLTSFFGCLSLCSSLHRSLISINIYALIYIFTL